MILIYLFFFLISSILSSDETVIISPNYLKYQGDSPRLYVVQNVKELNTNEDNNLLIIKTDYKFGDNIQYLYEKDELESTTYEYLDKKGYNYSPDIKMESNSDGTYTYTHKIYCVSKVPKYLILQIPINASDKTYFFDVKLDSEIPFSFLSGALSYIIGIFFLVILPIGLIATLVYCLCCKKPKQTNVDVPLYPDDNLAD